MVKLRHLISAAISVVLWGIATAHSAPVELLADVPEAVDHALVYRLDIPVTGAFNAAGVPYAVDRAAGARDFSRVAYHVQTEDALGQRAWIYVSLRAFTDDAAALGVPALPAGVTWQRAVSELKVRTNVAGVTTGDALRGWLEFWPTNYLPANGAGVPGASAQFYDFGDAPVPDGGYGSMQIHLLSPAGGEVLFALNRWGTGGAPFDLGIGNCLEVGPNGLQSDWTFLGNAGRYLTRRLDVYVVPGPVPADLGMVLTAPMTRAVYQRRAGDVGSVPIRGHLNRPADRIEARAIAPGGEILPFTPVFAAPDAPDAVDFEGTLTVPSGWHRIEVRALDGAELVAESAVEPVGVGEVFITAGQSNAANHGQTPIVPLDARVSARGLNGWQHAADPQPVASGGGGSPWSALGDLLAARFDVPIGFVSVAVGGTSVAQWQPGAADALYFRLTWALGVVGVQGARAVLWHQGESDARAGTATDVYSASLDTVIRQSRADAGWDLPWIVARVGYLPNTPQAAIDAVVAGQQRTIDADPSVQEGPTTDDLLGPPWRYDAVHFNEAGLREHALRWSDHLALPPCEGFADRQARPAICPDAARPPPPPDAARPPPPEDARMDTPFAMDAANTLGDVARGGDRGVTPSDRTLAFDVRESSDPPKDLDQGPEPSSNDAATATAAAARPVADCACRAAQGDTLGLRMVAFLAALLALGGVCRRRRPLHAATATHHKARNQR